LTPKAWRCRVSPPPTRFPFVDPTHENAYRKWEESYHDAISSYATCQYIETIGDDLPDPLLLGLIELHDQLSKATASDPLA